MISANELAFIETLTKEAQACYKRGDIENGDAIFNSVFDKVHPGLVEYTKNNPKALRDLIVMKNSSDEVVSGHARAILKYLKDRGVNL